MSRNIVKLILQILLLRQFANGARILGVFPYPSHSHQIVFRAITMELLKRGHELVVFTTYPVNNPKLKNYTEVSLEFLNDGFKNKLDFYKTGTEGPWSFLRAVYDFSGTISDGTLSHPMMQRLTASNSTEKFDLILIQCIFYDALYALSIRFNAPMIGISSLPMLAVNHYLFANPPLLEYSPDLFLGYTDDMNLWQRIVNTYYYLRQVYEYLTIVLPVQETVLRKHFGNDMPPASELSKNLSMFFVYAHPFFNYPRPNVPGIVQIAGCRLGLLKAGTLPKDLKKILDEGPGFIYFSLGSNIKSTQLPNETRDVLLETFAELPYTVLWKFESDELKNISSNVIIRKWLPQLEILGHPKIMLFMYQGGLQSTEEAIDNSVPLIGFPIFSDQLFNIKRLQSFGVAKKLDLTKLTKETLKSAILEILTNSSYKENMMKLHNLLQDSLYHPMDHAIWWIEHVIRHKGAPHIRHRARDMPWYKIGQLDIIAIFSIVLALLLYVSFRILRCMLEKIVQVTQQIHPVLELSTKKKQL